MFRGVVDYVAFRNQTNGYTVLKVRPDDVADVDPAALAPNGTVTTVGNVHTGIDVGSAAEFQGYWIDNDRYGRQMRLLNARMIEREAAPTLRGPHQVHLRGRIQHVTYFKEETGFAVIDLLPEANAELPGDAMAADGTVTVVGVMPNPMEGENIHFTGSWVNNEQYGPQFKAATALPIAPREKEGIIAYLVETVTGIGPKTAERIYNHFGDETLKVLDTDPIMVKEVPGLKPSLAERLMQSWQDSRGSRPVMIFLQTYGVSGTMAKRIYDHYSATGINAVTLIKTNPYQLARDVRGVGFLRADKIASAMGISLTARERLQAGLIYTLEKKTSNGHVFLPRDVLLEEAASLLRIDHSTVDLESALREVVLAGDVIEQPIDFGDGPIPVVYERQLYYSESGAANRLRSLLEVRSPLQKQMDDTDWETYLAELAEENNVELTDEQQSAVRAALEHKVSVLTGGPGTGKTTTLRMVIDALDREQVKVYLASPTGRAAKRLAEATGREAVTIHRLLGWDPLGGGFTRDQDNPLDCRMLVIDEASMIDIFLFYNMLKALAYDAHLLLVGDVDQLPSVGPGNVLRDVISSGAAHVTRLTRIFRQAQDSYIIENAHRINHGQFPLLDRDSKDFFMFKIDDPQSAAQTIVELVRERLEAKIRDWEPGFELDPLQDVQVIAPMYRGPIGVDALNQVLQEVLNPPTPRKVEQKFIGRVFRVGDKVMQTKNNYEKSVFNGDIGFIRGIKKGDDKLIEVVMDGHTFVTYSHEEADEQLIHAFCISTHRSQGSEYPYVIMPVMTQHYMMLQRNLIYTAITRAKQMVVLIGTDEAMWIAIRNNNVAQRYSALQLRIRGSAGRAQSEKSELLPGF